MIFSYDYNKKMDLVGYCGKYIYFAIDGYFKKQELSQFIQECINDTKYDFIKEKLIDLKSKFDRNEIGSELAMNKLKILLDSNHPIINNTFIQINHAYNQYDNIQDIQSINQNSQNKIDLVGYLTSKDSLFMFNEDQEQIIKFINLCVDNTFDPIYFAINKINRSNIYTFDDDIIVETIKKITDDIKLTDFRDENESITLIDEYVKQLNDTFNISMFGEVNSGKSTIINSIIGMEIAHTDVETCTSIPIKYINDQNCNIPKLKLDEYFIQQPDLKLKREYMGIEIINVLKIINKIMRNTNYKLTWEQWPCVYVKFAALKNKICVIDTPDISEQNKIMIEYANEALARSISVVIIFTCNKINTEHDIFNAINIDIHIDKHICLVANRWDEYRSGITDLKEKEVKNNLRERLNNKKYNRVFITIGDSAFYSSEINKYIEEKNKKPDWDIAYKWAKKCLRNETMLSEENVKEEYEDLSYKTLIKKVKNVLINSEISDLIKYLNDDLTNEIRKKTIYYICTKLNKQLTLFESKSITVRRTGISAIQDLDKELKTVIENKSDYHKSIKLWKLVVIQDRNDLLDKIKKSELVTVITDILSVYYDNIKQDLPDYMNGYKHDVSDNNKDDIIFLSKFEDDFMKYILEKINEKIETIITKRIEIASNKYKEMLLNTLNTRSKLIEKCSKEIHDFIKQVNIEDYALDKEYIRKINNTYL